MPFKDLESQRAASKRHYYRHRAEVIAKAKENSVRTRRRIRAWILKHLKENPCVDCGEDNTIVLEFDHVGEDGTKDFNISDAVRRGFSIKRVEKEVAKCEVRCANCHRKKTHERAGWTQHD